jgi:hypothetical protein
MISCPGEGYDPFAHRLCPKKVRLLYSTTTTSSLRERTGCTRAQPPNPPSPFQCLHLSTTTTTPLQQTRVNGVPDQIAHSFLRRTQRPNALGAYPFWIDGVLEEQGLAREDKIGWLGSAHIGKKPGKGWRFKVRGREGVVSVCEEFRIPQLLRPGELAGHNSHSRGSGRHTPVVLCRRVKLRFKEAI